MNGRSTFNDILTAAIRSWHERNADEFLLSLAVPIQEIDPLIQLPVISEKEQFSFLWDRIPGLCIAAAGQCQHLNLVGSQRFGVAQKFFDETFSQLVDVTPEAPIHARARILFSFSFYEQILQREISIRDQRAVQAVLPTWQLTNQDSSAWLRLNAFVSNESEAREIVEHLWRMSENLSCPSDQKANPQDIRASVDVITNNWQTEYSSALARGIDLVNQGELQKIVLAVSQSILLKNSLDPLRILSGLRDQQASSCRFLWQTSKSHSFFGASPERLLSVNDGKIRSDALAGTANMDDNGADLLRSDKNLREHQLVVASITKQFLSQGLKPLIPSGPQLFNQGKLIHLHTPIVAVAPNKLPLNLVDALHPTPAVAGLPTKKALTWLRALEPFDRGSYAAPIGWIDSDGNSEFRVAIRCGYSNEKNLEIMAGAGLVKGSSIEGELKEVALKFAVLADQLDLGENY